MIKYNVRSNISTVKCLIHQSGRSSFHCHQYLTSSRFSQVSAETTRRHRCVTSLSGNLYIKKAVMSSGPQLAVCQVIPQLHLLEQVASAEHIGTTAENLLEAMMTHPDCEAKVWPFFHPSLLGLKGKCCDLYPLISADQRGEVGHQS